MDLWIRSQDKEVLMIVNTITLAEDEIGTIIGMGIDGKVKTSLGKYKTKERALEVLDEISKILNPQKIINTFNIEKADMLNGSQYRIVEKGISDFSIIQYNNYVYEMPFE